MPRSWTVLFLTLIAAAVAVPVAAQPPPVRTRLAVLVDSSSEMLASPRWVTSSEDCAGWNPCSFSGNPTTGQESCNACVRDTIRYDPTCATNWDAGCRNGYAGCLLAVTGQTPCTAVMAIAAGGRRGVTAR